jgi:hypothetical protein
MENSSWILQINSCISFFSELMSKPEISKESSLVIALRKDVNEFEGALQSVSRDESKIKRTLLLMLVIDKEIERPSTFLNCCYYYKHWEKDGKRINKLGTDPIDLKKYHHSEIKGFSALGAAMIAHDLSLGKRRLLAQELGTYGFKSTPNDVSIAELILYDEIKRYGKEKTFFHLLHPHSNVFWFVLPCEIRKQIAHYTKELFKNEFWLLPQ